MMYYAGVDYAKAFSYIVVVDEKGQKVREAKVSNWINSLESFFKGFRKEELSAAVEATRNWVVMYDMLEQVAGKVVLAHPIKLKVVAETVCKSDKVDAAVMANLLRVDLIPKAYVPSKESRPARNLLRQRMFFVKVKTQIKNRISVILDRHPEFGRPKVTDIFGKEGMNWLEQVPIPQKERGLLDRELSLLKSVVERTKQTDKLVSEEFSKDENAKRLETIPGIGKFFAVLISNEIGDINRFNDAKKLHAYAGLVPLLDRSGGKIVKRGKLLKTGNKFLRWAAVEAAIPATRADGALKAQYESIRHRKGHNPAKIAVARRLLTIIWHILKDKRNYQEKKIEARNILGRPHNELADVKVNALA